MSELIFYAAISSDGYLAGPEGDMSWAEKYLASGEDYGYVKLIGSSSAILMGRATFDFEIESGSQGPRPLPTYVLTHIPELYEDIQDDNLYFTGGEISLVLDHISAKHPGQLFVMGGANVVRQLLDANRIDTMRLFVCPEDLGAGTLAFADDTAYNNFTLTDEKQYPSGIIEEVYRRLA
ncbi:MAG: dihydrofolate reductase family protein [Acidobacteria bacterium]|nr:dihydrofolate reductase family protein [Acidobacteriota bacterium]